METAHAAGNFSARNAATSTPFDGSAMGGTTAYCSSPPRMSLFARTTRRTPSAHVDVDAADDAGAPDDGDGDGDGEGDGADGGVTQTTSISPDPAMSIE